MRRDYEYEQRRGGGKILGIILLLVVFVACMASSFYVSRNVLMIYPVKGESMEPTIHNGDKVLLYQTKKLRYKDIIVFEETKDIEKTLIKRVIGLEGDKIESKFDVDEKVFHIYRNGVPVDESYIKEPMVNYSEFSLVVPKNKIYFLGDNRNISLDSHINGALGEISEVKGVVILRYKESDIEIIKRGKKNS